MAKLSKQELKGILKECIREILKEDGISFVHESSQKQPVGQRNRQILAGKKPVQQSSSHHEDEDDYSETPKLNESLMNAVDSMASAFKGSGNSDIFAEILKDTAVNTLQRQLAAEGNPGAAESIPVTKEERLQEQRELETLAGGGDMGKWAKIAFAKK